MKKKMLNFRIHAKRYAQFLENKKKRDMKYNIEYLDYLIYQDSIKIENNPFNSPDFEINSSDILFDIIEKINPINVSNSAEELTKKFNTIQSILSQILSYQREPFSDDDDRCALDEERIGLVQAKQIVYEDYMKFR